MECLQNHISFCTTFDPVAGSICFVNASLLSKCFLCFYQYILNLLFPTSSLLETLFHALFASLFYLFPSLLPNYSSVPWVLPGPLKCCSPQHQTRKKTQLKFSNITLFPPCSCPARLILYSFTKDSLILQAFSNTLAYRAFFYAAKVFSPRPKTQFRANPLYRGRG